MGAISVKGVVAVQWVKKFWQECKVLISKLIEVASIAIVLLLFQKVLLLTSEQNDIDWKAVLKDPQTLILGGQLIVICIQGWIMHRQAEISEKGLNTSERANAISKEVAIIADRSNSISKRAALLPTQQKALWEWLAAVKDAKLFFYEVQSSSFLDNKEKEKNLDLANRGRKILTDLYIQSREASIFFDKKIFTEIETWDLGENRGKLLSPFERRLRKIALNQYDDAERTKDIDKTYEEASNLIKEINNSKEVVIRLFKSMK